VKRGRLDVLEGSVKALWEVDLARGQKFVEKDCPVCGHVTLMKRVVPPYREPVMDRADFMARYEGCKTHFYCYVCGHTFKEGTKLEEI
jgi:rRNA maturation endonuclease Nob1